MRRRSAPRLLTALLVAASVPWASGRAAAPPKPPVIEFLNKALQWYARLSIQHQLAEPSDALFWEDARRGRIEVLRLAFQYARAAVALDGGTPAPAASDAASKAPSEQALARMSRDAAARLTQVQAEVDQASRQLARATGRRRAALAQQLAELRSELALARARDETVKRFVEIVSSSRPQAAAASGLLAQIEALERTVPEIAATAAKPGAAPGTAQPAAATAIPAQKAPPTGVFSLATDLFTLSRKESELRSAVNATANLREEVDTVRAPLLADLRATLQRGDQLSAEADTADTATLRARTADIESVTAHFRKVSAALVPLEQQGALLDTLKVNLEQWRAATERQYGTELRALLLRMLVLAAALALIFGASELWRRATFRYVQDARRRHQFLLLRRIVVGAVVALFIGVALVTEIGSLATFAGFITAGLAVALQNVILSIAAYFFLIGKYGVRVGDRVQIGEVVGDVIDLGLVRLHVMEMGRDGLPTGRVVIFSNAVLFQPASNFFKQLPGSNFSWHEVKLTLSPDSDYALAESKLRKAVESVYEQYRASIDEQHARMAQSLSIPLDEARPQSRLQLTASGLEITIRFPVPLERASAIDDGVTRALLDAVAREPRLKLVGSGTPTIQERTAAPQAAR